MFAEIVRFRNTKFLRLRIEWISRKRDLEDFLRFLSFGKMTLTWKEFLNLAAVVQHLYEPIKNCFNKKIDIKELNRLVAKAAQDYLDLFKDAKYMEFANTMRIG